MIFIIENKKLGLEVSLGDKEGDIIQDFIDLFIEKYSIDLYNKATLLIVRHELYYFVIKNIFGELKGGLLSSEISDLIHTNLNYE